MSAYTRKLPPFKRVQQWEVFSRIWYLFDAKWQNPFDSAIYLKKVLSGSHKPIYHPLSDVGDHVIVINTRHVAMPGDEWRKRVYFHHTGYPKGASWTLAYQLHAKDPTLVLWKAVYKEVGSSLLRGNIMERLHCFPDEDVPKELMANVSNQLRQLRPIPKSLTDYSEEEVEKYPKLFDWPHDHLLKK